MKERLIVCDSCCNLHGDLGKGYDLELVPFHLQLDDEYFVDDDNLDMEKYIVELKNADLVRSAAPSPQLFIDKIRMGKEVFVVTMSSKVSATYSNACLAKEMLKEEGHESIYVFDTKSAGGGETLVVKKIQECINKNMSFEDIVSTVNSYISELQIFFVFERLDNLIKNGRLSKTKAMIASMLSIKPILYGVDGEIEIFKKARGLKKAYAELVDSIGEFAKNISTKELIITYANCYERAVEIRNTILEKYNFKEVTLIPARGICATYEDDGGIMINY